MKFSRNITFSFGKIQLHFNMVWRILLHILQPVEMGPSSLISEPESNAMK